MFLEGVHQDVLGHLQAGDEIPNVLMFRLVGVELGLGHSQKGTVEVVNALKKINGKTLDSKVARVVHITLGALLEVEKICDGADILVLLRGELAEVSKLVVHVYIYAYEMIKTREASLIVYLQINNLLLLLFKLLADGILGVLGLRFSILVLLLLVLLGLVLCGVVAQARQRSKWTEGLRLEL